MVDSTLVVNLTELGVLVVGVILALQQLNDIKTQKRRENLWSLLQLRRQEDNLLKYTDALNLQWQNYDDFMSKYWSNTNPKAWARLWSYLVELDDLGYMVNQGMIDIKDIYELVADGFTSLWNKYQPIIEERRKRGNPKSMDWFEYLINELQKEKTRRNE